LRHAAFDQRLCFLAARLDRQARAPGPGRGKKVAANAASFSSVCARISVDDKAAIEAQRE
jgi:hypothetical protein